MYDSTITFTLDTICPWTYLGVLRLDEALRRHQAGPDADAVKFTVVYKPYELYPDATKEGQPKQEWFKRSRYGDTRLKMKTYEAIMTAYGQSAGIKYKFGGTIANTLDAHRVIQHFQAEKGPETADKLIKSLYSQYFENEKHPSSDETLLKAAIDAGVPEAEAKAFIEDRDNGIQDVKMMIREQAGNAIDAVPYILFEGKRRDIGLQGARDVEEYEKAIASIVKESK